MKIKKQIIFFLLISLGFGFITETLERRFIRTKEYDIELFISNKKIKIEKEKLYYWFKTGDIHQSFGSFSGKVLHDSYIKHYPNKQLAEKGTFYYGLKDGLWKTWYPNGSIKEVVRWRNGHKQGDFYAYLENGELAETGVYRRNRKRGMWVNFVENDTIWYKKDQVFNADPKEVKRIEDSLAGKKPFFKRMSDKVKNLFRSKEDSIQGNTPK